MAVCIFQVEKEDACSLFGILNEEYDPMRPNDYEKLTMELRRVKQLQEEETRKAEREKRQKREEEEREKKRQRSRDERKARRRRSRSSSDSSSSSHSGTDDENHSKNKNRRDLDKDVKRNNLFAPPSSLIVTDDQKEINIEEAGKILFDFL